MPDSALPPNLRGTTHWDYPKPLRWVPRGWTSFKWGAPGMLAGNQRAIRVSPSGDTGPAPIGESGSFQVSRFPGAPGLLKYLPLYVAFTLPGGRHVRLGARWDNVDEYTTFPTFASRKFTGGDAQDTSTR